MSVFFERSQEILNTVNDIKMIIDGEPTVAKLNDAKERLMTLAARQDLFPESDFPWPTNDNKEKTYCVYKGEDGEYALYVDMVWPGVSNTPHDHGRSWAIVAAVHGHEKHHLYRRVDDGNREGFASLESVGELVVEVGKAVSMMIGGIHSIEAIGTKPVMNLHCYRYAFEAQHGRNEFDIEHGTYSHSIAAAGVIEDMPLHSDMSR